MRTVSEGEIGSSSIERSEREFRRPVFLAISRLSPHWNYLRELNLRCRFNFRLLPIVEMSNAWMLHKLLAGQFFDQRNPRILRSLIPENEIAFECGLNFWRQADTSFRSGSGRHRLSRFSPWVSGL